MNARVFGLAGLSLIVALCIVINCFSGPTQASSGGSGTEIVGVVEYPEDSTGAGDNGAPKRVRRDGAPMIDGGIFLYPRFARPSASWAANPPLPQVRTENDGAFRISRVPAGSYLLEASDGSGMGKARTIDVSGDADTIDLGVITLDSTASVRVRADVSLPTDVEYYVGVKGTRLVAYGDSRGVAVNLESIPTGVKHSLVIWMVKPFNAQYEPPGVVLEPGMIYPVELIAENFQ